MRILVADDDPMLITLLSATFEKRGWETTGALDVMQVLKFAKEEPLPDMILLDLTMPGGSGLVALERLKALAATADIPVVVVSNSIDPAMPATVKKMGALAFVKKPVNPEEIAGAIERYFAG